MFQVQSGSPFPIDAIVNEVMNQVVLNNACFQKDDTTTNKKKCHGHSVGKNCTKANANSKKKHCCNIVYEKKPMHHEDTAEYAKVSFDVAGFTDKDINVEIDEEYIVTITGERTNALGDVFKIDRKFRLDKKTTDVDRIDANIINTDNEGGGSILEVIVKKKVINKVGPRIIKVTTTTQSNAAAFDELTTDDASIGDSDDKVGDQRKKIETVNDDKKEVNTSDEDNKKEGEVTTSVDDLEFEQIWNQNEWTIIER